MAHTPVVFRKFSEGDIIALFPTIGYRRNYTVESYMRYGQHGDVDYQNVIAGTKLASEDEYRDLLKELESIGYTDLKVCKRYRPVYS